ncbi:MAG: hypothetical protein ACFCD0_00940 [Gemmataceae bacterium]
MSSKNRTNLRVERLETRWVPASWNWTIASGSLTVTQATPAIGNEIQIDDAGNTFTLIDDTGAASTTTTTVINTTGISNVTLNLLGSDTVPVDYDLSGTRPGNLTINLNNGLPRAFDLNDDVSGTVGGNLRITDGLGSTSVAIGGGGTFVQVGGNLSVDLGLGADSLTIQNAQTFAGGNLDARGAESITITSSFIGGSTNINNFGEINPGAASFSATTFGGGFTYLGGNGADDVTFTAGTAVGGFTYLNLMNQIGADSTSVVSVDTGSSLNGGLFLSGGNLGAETLTLDSTSFINGSSVNVNLMGGDNVVNIEGALGGGFTGPSFSYNGGAGADSINFNPAIGSGRPRIFVNTGAGNDIFRLNTTNAFPTFVYANMGAGADTVPPVVGPIGFPMIVINV